MEQKRALLRFQPVFHPKFHLGWKAVLVINQQNRNRLVYKGSLKVLPVSHFQIFTRTLLSSCIELAPAIESRQTREFTIFMVILFTSMKKTTNRKKLALETKKSRLLGMLANQSHENPSKFMCARPAGIDHALHFMPKQKEKGAEKDSNPANVCGKIWFRQIAKYKIFETST